MSQHRYNIGIYHQHDGTWYPFGYEQPRLAKPHPCFSDYSPQLGEIWRELSQRDRAWVIRRATTGEMQGARISPTT